MVLASLRRSVVCALAALALTGLVSCGGKKELNFIGTGCPNGVVDTGELCDDANSETGDGCNAACQLEPGWSCSEAPSVCVQCGNSTLEGTEECDDGNITDNDGCSSQCKIEGSCSAPKPIVLDNASDGDGLLGQVASATGALDIPQVEAGDCATRTSGAGADRIFEVDLPRTADLEVKVTASFDAIVRVMTSPCTLTDEVPGGCAAIATTSVLVVPTLAAGKYYIAVDSNASTQIGPFRLDVAARCPLENAYIDRVVLQQPFRTHIVNTNRECSVRLSRIGIYSQPEATDTPALLPDQLLGPLERRVLTSQTPVPAGQTYQGNIPYDTAGYAGAFYLCRGTCDTTNGVNVYDALRWRGATAAPPAGPSNLQFDADAVALDNRLLKSYYRVLTEGTYPNFKSTDFAPAYFVETFDDGALDGWTAPASTFYTAEYEAPAGTIGSLALLLTGGNPNTAVWDGPKIRFMDNSGATMDIQPEHVSLWVRSSTTNVTYGQVFFGNPGTEGGAFAGQFRDNGTFGFGAPVTIAQPPYVGDTWYHVEYQNIDWNALTATVLVNSTSQGTLTMAIRSVGQLSVRNLTNTDAKLWLDQIIVE
jgi:cysteine-rich repeat protein